MCTNMELAATSSELAEGSGHSNLYGSIIVGGNARPVLGNVYNISNIYQMVSDGILDGQKRKKPPGRVTSPHVQHNADY